MSTHLELLKSARAYLEEHQDCASGQSEHLRNLIATIETHILPPASPQSAPAGDWAHLAATDICVAHVEPPDSSGDWIDIRRNIAAIIRKHAPAPTQEPGELLKHCQAFIREQQIICAEACHQTDRVSENAATFIEGVCEIIGYHKTEDASHEL